MRLKHFRDANREVWGFKTRYAWILQPMPFKAPCCPHVTDRDECKKYCDSELQVTFSKDPEKNGNIYLRKEHLCEDMARH